MSEPATIKARILSVAEEQFRTQGYSQTTMDYLAELLGMSKKTLYENFRSKEQIAEAMLKDIGDQITAIHTEVMNSDMNTVEKLNSIGPRMQQCLLTIGSMKLLNDLKRNAPELLQKFKQVKNEKVRSLWSNLLEEGMRKGYFRKEINTELFMTSHMAAIEKLLEGEPIPTNIQTFTAARADLLDIFLNGILTAKGREAESKNH
jgi:AcrR family transcriptional regulator